MVLAIGSAPDPFTIREAIAGQGYRKADGREWRSPALDLGETTAVIVTAGYSQISNYGELGPYVPTHAAKIDNFCFYDGGNYEAAEPMLGATGPVTGYPGGNMFLRVADKLIEAETFDRIILVPTGVGGTVIADWATGGSLEDRLLIASQRLALVGLDPTMYCFSLGGVDGSLGVSQATWEAGFAAMVGRVRDAGFSAPWFVAQDTYIENITYSAIRAAQAAVVNSTDIFSGPDTDTLPTISGYRIGDGTHYTITGLDAGATLWASAIQDEF